MDKKLPIGVFDSGLGGLTVVHEIKKLLPSEDIIYLGDTARVPYGTRSSEVIKKFSEEDLKFLLSKNVKCIVIACHTASSVAGKYLIEKYKDIKIVEVISPTIEYAKNLPGKTVVLATRATVNSKAFSSKLGSNDIACPLFVPLIEEGEIEGELIELLVKKYINRTFMNNLILGCTHYPLIRGTIKKVGGDDVTIVNPGECTAQVLKDYLSVSNLLNEKAKTGDLKLYVTDLNERFIKVAEMFLREKISGNIEKVDLE